MASKQNSCIMKVAAVLSVLLTKPQCILQQLGDQLKCGDLGRQRKMFYALALKEFSGDRGNTRKRKSMGAFLAWKTKSTQNLVH